MNELWSHLIAFVAGITSGVVGKFLADKLTDARRRREAASGKLKEFALVARRMPDLLAEMQTDVRVATQTHWREFFVIPDGLRLSAPPKSFFYTEDASNDYLNKARILEAKGYVQDITPGNAPKFRMREDFVEMLLQWKATQ
jgi:hypothetical protein